MRELSDIHEDKVAQDLSGKRSANSGAGVLKGDVFNTLWCIECKASGTPLFSLSKGLLSKTVTEAHTRQLRPAISFMHIAGDPAVPKSLRIVDYVYLIPAPLRNPKQRITALPVIHHIDEWLELGGRTFRFYVPVGVPSCWRVTTPASAKVLLSPTRSSRDGFTN